jgi:hypothetical protein
VYGLRVWVREYRLEGMGQGVWIRGYGLRVCVREYRLEEMGEGYGSGSMD